jgi:hypothetical protein
MWLLSCSPTPSSAPSTLDKDREELRKMVLASSSSTDMEENEGDCPVFVDREGNIVEVGDQHSQLST